MGKLLSLAFIPYILWFGAISLPPVKIKQAANFSSYVLPCQYNDKTININVTIDNSFTPIEQQDIFNGLCIALKAFRECKFLRKNWPAQKELGTDLIAHKFLYIHNDTNMESPACGYTMPNDNPTDIWINQLAWTRNCDRPSQVIFHEALHLSAMPPHNYVQTGRYFDPIEETVRMCLK